MQLACKHLTLIELKRHIENVLSVAIDAPLQLETERNWFIESTLGINLTSFLATPELLFSDTEKLELLNKQLKQRVEKHMPIQYILGEAWFYGLKFNVTPSVLIPRPETELLIETAIDEINTPKLNRSPSPCGRGLGGGGQLSVLDLATGSGCIGIAIKKKCPTVKITATDISETALNIAKQNAALNDVEINFRLGSWFDALQPTEKFDLICCNPPYISQSQANTLTTEVLNEPHLALFSESDPVELYQYLIREALNYLNPNGKLLFELEAGLYIQLETFLKKNNLKHKTITDYAGIARHLQILN